MRHIISIFVLTLVMSTAGVTNVWADGDDPVPFIILPPGGDDGGGDVPPLPGGLGDNDGGGSGGGQADPKSPVQMPTVVQDGYTLYIKRVYRGNVNPA